MHNACRIATSHRGATGVVLCLAKQLEMAAAVLSCVLWLAQSQHGLDGMGRGARTHRRVPHAQLVALRKAAVLAILNAQRGFRPHLGQRPTPPIRPTSLRRQ